MIITDYLERNAKLFPDEVSLVEINPSARPGGSMTWREFSLIEASAGSRYRREMTWREFDVKANRFANLLLTRGVKKGDKVGVLLMNCLEWLPIYFGILKCGALAVPLNYRYTADEIDYCLSLAEVSILVFGPEFTERVENVLPKLTAIRHFFFANSGILNAAVPAFADDYAKMTLFCSSVAPAVALTEEDDAAIYFSSGTTGFPKAILHNHLALASSCRTEQAHHGQTHEDVFLCIPPLYHTGAKMHWFGSLLSGGKAVILKGVKPEWILRTVSEEGCTIVWLLVPWAQDILDAIERGDVTLADYRLRQWRLMHIGAQPVPPSLVKRWLRVFPGHQYDVNYGLSESTGPGCVHLGVENIEKLGAIGKAGFLWEAKVADEQGETLPPEVVGELWVKGPGVMKRYYRNPEATAEVLKGSWLCTGDMAKTDADGFIYLVDRKKDVIISGGENLYPVQIEDFLRAMPKIKDCAVIGLSDPRLGEIAAAIIEIREGESCSEAEINEFCQALPRYKRPRKIIFDTVPRNPTGKIEKPKLRERYKAVRLVEAEYNR